jgi:hypothetical protein
MTTLLKRGKGSSGVVGVGRFSGWFCYDGGQTGDLHWGFLETVADFLKIVELYKGLVVLPFLASLVEVYGKSWSHGKWVIRLVGKDV